MTTVSAPRIEHHREPLGIGEARPRISWTLTDAPPDWRQQRYAITVTRGLMQTLNREELEAVLAHELTHVMNRDVRTMVIASVFAGVITLLSQLVFRVIQFGGLSRGGRKGGNRNDVSHVPALLEPVAVEPEAQDETFDEPASQPTLVVSDAEPVEAEAAPAPVEKERRRAPRKPSAKKLAEQAAAEAAAAAEAEAQEAAAAAAQEDVAPEPDVEAEAEDATPARTKGARPARKAAPRSRRPAKPKAGSDNG